MKQMLFMEKYPVFTLEVEKTECAYDTTDALLAYFKEKIAADPVAILIAEFDHAAHTRSLENGEVAAGILEAKMVIFCFGQKLPTPQMMAARPRSINIADMGETFVITFLEAPMYAINETMEGWAKGIINSQG
jgi:hypothetical protein